MNPLFTTEEFQKAKSYDKLFLKCNYCGQTFFRLKKQIQTILKGSSRRGNRGLFCSHKCSSLNKSQTLSKIVPCKQCQKEFRKTLSQIKKSKNNFCSQSCAASYQNAHKTTGTRISKLEKWLSVQLPLIYPTLPILYNDRLRIRSELDIYIPSLNLAFELNGIFHYEPIYGIEQLNKIQNNDQRKFQACIENKIELCLIDVSNIKYFKPEKVQHVLEIITTIINKKIGSPGPN